MLIDTVQSRAEDLNREAKALSGTIKTAIGAYDRLAKVA
jgi:hypothetical protein